MKPKSSFLVSTAIPIQSGITARREGLHWLGERLADLVAFTLMVVALGAAFLVALLHQHSRPNAMAQFEMRIARIRTRAAFVPGHPRGNPV